VARSSACSGTFSEKTNSRSQGTEEQQRGEHQLQDQARQ
jgi:hypothetical protein